MDARIEKSGQIQFPGVQFRCSRMSADSNRDGKPQRSCSSMKFILFRLWTKSYLQYGAEHTLRCETKFTIAPFLSSVSFCPQPIYLCKFCLAALVCSPPSPPPAFTLFWALFCTNARGRERVCVCICVRFLFFFPAAQQFTTVVAPYIHLVSFCLQSEVPSTLTNVILQLLLTLRAQCSFISHKFCASVADRHYCTD